MSARRGLCFLAQLAAALRLTQLTLFYQTITITSTKINLDISGNVYTI